MRRLEGSRHFTEMDKNDGKWLRRRRGFMTYLPPGPEVLWLNCA